MKTSWRAGCWAMFLALMGMVTACASPGSVELTQDDAALDQVWLGLARGDVEAARTAATQVNDPLFRERALADVAVSEEGRSKVLSQLRASGSWLACRYFASRARAREWLGTTAREQDGHPALLLEEVRLSGTSSRRESMARSALGASPGGPEALALLVESLLGRGQFTEAEQLLLGATVDTARLRLLRRQLAAYTGRLVMAGDGLLMDLSSGHAVPRSVQLLQQILELVPLASVEHRVAAALAAGSIASDPSAERLMHAAEQGLCSRLAERSGDLSHAVALASSMRANPSSTGTAAEQLGDYGPLTSTGRQLARWQQRLAAQRRTEHGAQHESTALQGVLPGWENQVDEATQRVGSPALDTLRLAHEWDLAARESYGRVLKSGDALSLQRFLELLDERADPLGSHVTLEDVPRIDYGLFGDMLDTRALRERMPQTFIAAGKALGMPPELTWYDLADVTVRELPDPPGGLYDECHVLRQRVPGFAASQGARFAGAGLDRFVFLDLEQVVAQSQGFPDALGHPWTAWPAAGSVQRRDLSEPLDVAWRIAVAARRDAGDDYDELVLESLSLHERRHIIDVRRFLENGFFGQLGDVFSAGVFPGAVRAEVERRAQLDALREARDPRIPLAHALSYLPVEGAALASEHARGYARLLADFVEVLDERRWKGAGEFESLGLNRNQVLVQQLHKLGPETVRSIAMTIEL